MDNKIKLLVAITVSESKILIRGQLGYMKQKGFDTYLLYSPEENDLIDLSNEATELHIDLHREIHLFKDLTSLLKIIKTFRKVKPHIVNAGTPKAGFLCILAAWICNVPIRIYTVRGYRHESLTGIKRKIMWICEWLTGKMAHKIICISPSVKELGVKEKLLPFHKIVILGKGSSNGLDLTRFNPNSISNEVLLEKKKNLNIEADDIVLGFVGRLIPRKGVKELILSWQDIRTMYPYTKLLLVGDFDDNQTLEPEILEIIRNDSRIISTGRVNDVQNYMSLMDLFVFPAHWEGFGNVLIEAAALGVPIITTTGTGVRDAVDNGYNATLIPVKNIIELKKAIANYLDNPELLKMHGDNGKLWAKNFSNESIWKELNNLYLKEYNLRISK